jgi:hypothetical protein
LTSENKKGGFPAAFRINAPSVKASVLGAYFPVAPIRVLASRPCWLPCHSQNYMASPTKIKEKGGIPPAEGSEFIFISIAY